MRQQIQQSKIAIAELIVKLQEEQAKLERMEARVEKYEEAIAFLQEAIAEDPLLWEDVCDRLNPPADEVEAISIIEAIPDSPTSEQIFDAECLPEIVVSAGSARIVFQEDSEEAIALPPTIIWNGNGVVRLGCAKQKLAKEWAELLTLWGCATSVVKVECFSDKEIKWEVAIANITRSQLETLAKAHTSPHAEVPTRAGSKVAESDNNDEVSATGAIQVKSLEDVNNDVLDGNIIKNPIVVPLSSGESLDSVLKKLESERNDQVVAIVDQESSDGETEGDRLQSPSPDQAFEHPVVNSATVEEVLEGASPLSLKDEQIDELEQVLGAIAPSIDDIADDKPSAYAEEMALKIKPGTKLKSLPFPADPKHKSSRKRTGVVRRLEREGAYIYAFVSELTEAGNDSRHTAFYNLEAVEIVEEAPAIDIAFDRFEPFDPTEDALGVVEAQILQFITEKAAQADLYEGNDPTASLSEIGDAIKLDSPDWDKLHTALDNLEARGSILHRDIYGVGDRWQVASEKLPQKEHNFKVGDRVRICGDSKGSDLVGKTGTLTAVSRIGCVLCLDGEDEKTRLFFCKEDLIPCSIFSQAA